jgi:RND superfamily putative drug exporter
LPIKAALMSALTLGSTMGILTWMFVEDGHGSGLLNYTPQPLMAPMIGLIIAVIWGLSTDYEVFLVSRMVEARQRGMSTAESIRIGTATTGRLITGAALVLAVVVGAFAFSDLVMMKYLAFGLLIALLLDATVIRMFLVPAIMKLLGDDCWWAPQWMKRVQERLGLGEIELPDERKRPTVRAQDGITDQEALVGAGAPVPHQVTHDPGHPAAPPPPPPGRGPLPPVRPIGPSAAGTSRIPTPSGPPPPEPPTTRFAAQPDSAATEAIDARDALNATATERAARVEQKSGQEKREIESWLGELRGSSTPTTAIPSARRGPNPVLPERPSAQPTRAMPDPAGGKNIDAGGKNIDAGGNAPTTAIPAQRDPGDPEPTEKIDTRKTDDPPTRRGGGVSAADLLRREGRL